jgi:hypothetical protein
MKAKFSMVSNGVQFSLGTVFIFVYKLRRPRKSFFCLLFLAYSRGRQESFGFCHLYSFILVVDPLANKVNVALVLTGLQQGLPGAAAREEERLVGRSPGVDRKSSVRSRGYFYGGSGGQR